MELTLEEKNFFEELEKKSSNNPMIRIQAASQYIENMLMNAFKTQQGIVCDRLCYMLSVMSGVSIADTAKNNIGSLFQNMNDVNYIPRTKLETETGIFWIGSDIDKYIYNHRMSVWNIIKSLYSLKKKESVKIDINQLIENNTKKMGNINSRVWNDNNPYEEIESAIKTYKNLYDKLEPFKLQKEEHSSVFALALGDVIVKTERLFPKEINVIEQCMDTILFYAHMDV